MSQHDYGKSWVSRAGFGLWWNYDLTIGAAAASVRMGRTLRFFGITIGDLVIGVSVSRKESIHE